MSQLPNKAQITNLPFESHKSRYFEINREVFINKIMLILD